MQVEQETPESTGAKLDVTNGTDKLIPCDKIVEGFNYRRRYSEDKLASLKASIAEKGLIQPVAVREADDGTYQLIVGGRRLRAFKAVRGDDALIPARVLALTDADATAIMMDENSQREDPSVIEDAEGASRMLGLCKGDRDEAARRLGWTRNKFDRRVALMNATSEVRDAYLEDKINVGHVEVLAALRREVQVRVLGGLLSSSVAITVEQLKAMAEQSLLSLEAAIFDKTECATCDFFTGNQQALFETSFSGSRCTNKVCYEEKTKGELEKRQAELADTYQVVRIVRQGENATVRPLRADGKHGVGEEQAQACRTCGDFGACVSAVPDKLGIVYKDVCFNSECNDTKAAAHAAANKADQEAAKPEGTQVQGSAVDVPGAGTKAASPQKGEAANTTPAGAGKGNGATDAPKPTPGVATIRNQVRQYREAIWRQAYQAAALKLPVERNRALLLAIVLNRPGDIDSLMLSKAVSKVTGTEVKQLTDSRKLLTQLLALDRDKLGAALQHIPAYLSETMGINQVVGLLQAMEADIAAFWVVNETFFNELTKTEIDAVCVEIGLDSALGEGYTKLKNGAKADFVKGVLKAEGFEYKGAVPSLMDWNKC